MRALAGIAITLFYSCMVFGSADAPQPAETSNAPTATADCPEGMSALFLGMAPMLQATCEILIPSYAAETQADFATWQRVWSRCLGPQFEKDMASYRLQAKPRLAAMSEPEKQRTTEDCKANVLDLATSVRAPAKEYSTPEATWAEFRAALAVGDKPRALRCLTSVASPPGKIVNSMTPADLKTLGTTLADVKRTAASTEGYVEAFMVRPTPDGKGTKGFYVRFAPVNGNWLIESL
jgi:hypothetical protein